MRTLAVLFAASSLVWPLTLRAGTPKPPNHADLLRKQMQHQQQAAQQQLRQQQALEQKMVRQQQDAYKQQLKAMQAYQHQQAQAAGQKPTTTHHVAKPSQPSSGGSVGLHHAGTTHHGSGYRVYHHRNNQIYRHHTRWPASADPESAALHHLKSVLDGVARNTTSTSTHANALANALGRVVEVNPPPTMAAVRDLSHHLTRGLALRTSAQVNTTALALTLRGAMNSSILSRDDLQTVLNQHKATLRAGGVPAAEASAIESALMTITRQEHAVR